jgi:hypothetical protein
MRYSFALALAFGITAMVVSISPMLAADTSRADQSKWVYPGSDGKLMYARDSQGNSVPDYSYAGYEGSGVRIPDAPVKITLDPSPAGSDDAARIQSAIDQVSKMPVDAAGLRGTVLLKRGTYNIGQPLTIAASGVVLRGQGDEADGTVLRATFNHADTFIKIAGTSGHVAEGKKLHVIDALAPVGQIALHLDSAEGLSAGDSIVIQRDTNQAWVHDNGMDELPPRADGAKVVQWTPGPREAYERTIKSIDHNQITLDIPLPTAIEAQYGGALVYRYSADGRITHCGVENLRAVSAWIPGPGIDPMPGKEYGVNFKDPANLGRKVGQDTLEHANTFVWIDNAQDVWVRDFACVDFYYGGVVVAAEARRVTIQDGSYEVADPAKGYYQVEPHDKAARYAFCIWGEMTLTQRCLATHARHSFMTQKSAAGPTVFLDCDTIHQDGTSQTHQRWSTGVLYDCVGLNHPTAIDIADRQNMGSGHGWSGAYCMLWNCNGTFIAEATPTAPNWAVGCTGKRKAGYFGPMQPQVWDSWNQPVNPMSLYRAQLVDRLGQPAIDNIARHPIPSD